MKKRLMLIMVCCLLFGLAGCGAGEKKEHAAADSKSQTAEKSDEKKEETPAKTDENKAETKEQAEDELVIIDMAGREVRLPKKDNRRALTDSPTTQRLYTYINGLNDLVGVSARDVKNLTNRPYALANPEILNMKSFGGGYFIEDWEAVLLAKPDVIFCDQHDASAYDQIQRQTGCPVVALDYGTGVIFDPKLYQSLELIGKVMGKEERAKEVIDYMEAIKKDLNERTKDIPESERKTAYAAGLAWNGPHGIEGTRENYPLFDAVNAINVVTGIGKDGLVEVDKEKIMEWNPEYIFIDLASIHLIQEDYNQNKAYYQLLSAFKNDKVYTQLAFVWCDINIDTAMGDAYFVGKTIYPEKFADVDPVAKVNEIYEFLVGKPVYEELAGSQFGGYQKVNIADFDSNRFFKEK